MTLLGDKSGLWRAGAIAVRNCAFLLQIPILAVAEGPATPRRPRKLNFILWKHAMGATPVPAQLTQKPKKTTDDDGD